MSSKKTSKAIRNRRMPLGQNPVKGAKTIKQTVTFKNGVKISITQLKKDK